MHHLETEILIEATPQEIWNVLMDFESYPDWNPFITSIEGNVQVGRSITVFLQPPGQKVSTFSPKVLVANPQKEFRW
ncbi:MAG: SRPBCC domain-containing protein, partial [Bacteroidota bacterium]